VLGPTQVQCAEPNRALSEFRLPSTTTIAAAPASVATGGCLTTDEVARSLRRSIQTIRRFVAQEGLPVRRVKRRLYFDAAEVDAWLRARSGEQEPEPPTDPYRAAIKNLVDEAAPLTAEQAAKIRAVLGGAA
jgi:excisionase family DNA binding protein